MFGGARALVLFDGECGACNRFVLFVLDHDTRNRFRFAPLGGETGRRVVGDFTDIDSLFLVDAGEIYVRSEAILRIVCSLGGLWRAAVLARCVPRAWRDRAYDLCARYRRSFPGEPACRILEGEERARFLP